MAVTSIHAIKATDDKAIAYIINTNKTDGGILTEYFACGNNAEQAAEYFAATRQLGNGSHSAGRRSTILAQHIMQSFAPGEVTPKQVFEIGKRLADEVLKGEYQYVLATHIDKEHIHNHLIFCNTNQMNFRTFETNENKGQYSYKTVRKCRTRFEPL